MLLAVIVLRLNLVSEYLNILLNANYSNKTFSDSLTIIVFVLVINDDGFKVNDSRIKLHRRTSKNRAHGIVCAIFNHVTVTDTSTSTMPVLRINHSIYPDYHT